MATPATDVDSIRAWAGPREVAFDVQPLPVWHDGSVRRVGYVLDLSCRVADLDPGCAECRDAVAHLHLLAQAALAGLDTRVECHVPAETPVIRFRPRQSGPEPAVHVTIEIAEEEDYFQPIDEAETRCAQQLEARLTGLGARPLSSI